jgi:hypothetical protein
VIAKSALTANKAEAAAAVARGAYLRLRVEDTSVPFDVRGDDEMHGGCNGKDPPEKRRIVSVSIYRRQHARVASTILAAMQPSLPIRAFSPLVSCLVLACAAGVTGAAEKVVKGKVTLASSGKAAYAIVLPAEASEPRRYAASQLASYLERLSGAKFEIQGTPVPAAKQIVFESGKSAGKTLGDDAYAITLRGDRLVLAGDTDRAILFAVYDVLERLGCRWLAPQFDFYKGEAEVVPSVPELVLTLDEPVVERPHFPIRKLDVEEGRSHTTENLKQLVEWAPKLRYNTLMIPRDYGGRGRVTWDQWRDAITPEAKKRGLFIEVGGHGYENFINAKVQDGKLFERHPDWFGKDDAGKRSKLQKRVFCTSNEQAVDFVTGGVLDYLNKHPEIDVFQLWPPDGADWCTCDPCKALGEPQERQALLVNHIQAAVEKAKPGVRLEIIAYSKALQPPTRVKLDPRILVDYCPINQSFEVPINDPSSTRNAEYVRALTAWRERFPGDIGLYSYYRMYAWKSLPALIPHYMQADLRYYRSLKPPLAAVMIYGEPGDWGTYELNHIALGRLGWDADADMDVFVKAYCVARYGADRADETAKALVSLGDTVRTYGSLPFTSLKSAQQIATAKQKLEDMAARLPKSGGAFARLGLMFRYAIEDLDLQHDRSAKAPEAQVRKKVDALFEFLVQHKTDGVFIVSDADRTRMLKRYGIKTTAADGAE